MSAITQAVLVPIHREGWPLIAIFAAVTIALFFLAEPLGWLGVVLTAWCTYFFRDPDRVTPTRSGLVISPADGIVQMIQPASPPPEINMGARPLMRISIFMNVFNVHVNRIPVEAEVVTLAHRPGKFVNASLDKASEENERQSVHLRLADGRDVGLVQIAGLVARRIHCDLTAGMRVRAGERFGILRFGSRVDVYLPDGVQPLDAVGQTTLAGETVIAELNTEEPTRLGERR